MFTMEFMLEYNSAGLPPEVISKVIFEHLGGFLYNIIFMAWTHLVCNHEKPLVEFPVDCLVSSHVHPVRSRCSQKWYGAWVGGPKSNAY
jgi:hypothetical protein